MAQAITFIVMAYPPTHTADNDAYKYKKGDIINAKLTSECPEDPHPGSRFVFVDVADVPNSVAIKIKNVISGEYSDEDNTQIVNRRYWYLDRELIPAQRLSDLLANRRGSATWAEFKTIVKRRANEVNITDGDFA